MTYQPDYEAKNNNKAGQVHPQPFPDAKPTIKENPNFDVDDAADVLYT